MALKFGKDIDTKLINLHNRYDNNLISETRYKKKKAKLKKKQGKSN